MVKSSVGAPSFISVDGFDGLLRGGRLLGTSFKLDRGQEVQFLKTLSHLYYIYAFGESPGKVMIGGLLFFADCSDPSGNAKIIGDLNTFYEENNAYDRPTPIRIAAGNASFRCLLTNFSVSGDMNPYNFASFSLAFTLIPPKKK